MRVQSMQYLIIQKRSDDEKNPFSVIEEAVRNNGSGTQDYEVVSKDGEKISLDDN